MKKLKITLLTILILINSIFTTGCWNYREVDQFSIVAGLAVDKGINSQYQLTVEIIQISGGTQAKTTTKTMTAEGKTLFDAARNMISLSGKKLYWAHSKVIILSKEIASEGVAKVLEWYNRDSETRESVHLLVSRGASAKEILEGQKSTDEIESFMLDQMIQDQVTLSKAPIINILDFDIASKVKSISEIIPAVSLKQMDGKMVSQVMGAAIIKNDKLVGFLDGDETKDLIFIRNDVKGGILTEEMQATDTPASVALEIFNNETSITSVVDGKNIEINLNIGTTVAIDEIVGAGDFIDEEERRKLEQTASNTLKNRIESLIKKMQTVYEADIFDFGTKLNEDKPQVWKNVSNNWGKTFKDLKVNVTTKVHIKNSAMLSNSIGKGE